MSTDLQTREDSAATVASDPDRLLTAEEYARFDDGYDGPTELVDGRVIRMTQPSRVHGEVQFWIGHLLINWGRSRGFKVAGESGVVTRRSPDRVRGPDVMVYPAGLAYSGGSGFFEAPPILCVEVASPSNSLPSLRVKADEYLAFGVKVVWLVLPSIRSVEVVTPEGRTLMAFDQTIPPHADLPDLELPVAELFAELPSEEVGD